MSTATARPLAERALYVNTMQEAGVDAGRGSGHAGGCAFRQAWPGNRSPFCFLKQWGERISLWLTDGPNEKVELMARLLEPLWSL